MKEKKHNRHIRATSILINWIILLTPFFIIYIALLYTVPSLFPTYHSIIMIITYLLPLALSILWTTGRIPYHFVEAIRKYALVVGLLFIFLATCLVMIPWTFIFTLFLLSNEVLYADAIIPTICVALLAALLLLWKSFRTWSYSGTPLPIYHIDRHISVCQLIGVTPKTLLSNHRRQQDPSDYQSNIVRGDLRNSESIAEMSLSLLFISILLCILGFILWIYEPEIFDNIRSIFGLVPILLMLSAVWFYAIIGRYGTWCKFWERYWIYIRNMTIPIECVLDTQPPIPRNVRYPFSAFVFQDGNKRKYIDGYKIEADIIAKNEKISYNGPWTVSAVEWLHWYLRTKQFLKGHRPESVTKFESLNDAWEELTQMPDSPDEKQFSSYVRASLLLEAITIAETWPDVFESVANLRTWADDPANQLRRNELFSLATTELESIRSSPSWPVPQSVKWLTGLVLICLSLFPIALSWILTAILT